MVNPSIIATVFGVPQRGSARGGVGFVAVVATIAGHTLSRRHGRGLLLDDVAPRV